MATRHQRDAAIRRSRKRAGGRSGDFERARKVLARHWKRLSRRQGVNGLSVGLRQRSGQVTDEVVLRVYVDEKIVLSELPPRRRLPSAIEGVPVDVVVRGGYQPLAKRTPLPFETLQGGVAISPEHKPESFGTLGMPVSVLRGDGSREPRYLTNAHVVLGDYTKSGLPANAPLVQFAEPEGGSRVIGYAVKSKICLNSLVDGALVKPEEQVAFLPGIRDLDLPRLQFGQLTDDDVSNEVEVIKVGAATGRRSGIVDSVCETFTVPGRTFLLQIAIRPLAGGDPFAAAGDSGAVVVKGEMLVGLLHGVATNGDVAIACHLADVRDALDFQLLSEEP